MSGRVNVLQTKQIFVDADISGNLTSEAIDFTHMKGFSVQFEWVTSDVTGTFTLEVSNTGDVWTTVPAAELSSTTEIAGADGTGFINVIDHQGYKFRVVFVNTGGSAGTLNAWVGGKGL